CATISSRSTGRGSSSRPRGAASICSSGSPPSSCSQSASLPSSSSSAAGDGTPRRPLHHLWPLPSASASAATWMHSTVERRRATVMSAEQWLTIVIVGLPALLLVLWPVLRGGGAVAATDAGADRTLELLEEKAAVYRSLKELQFDHEAGHLSDDDYRELCDPYEARAADLLARLDALGPTARPRRQAAPVEPPAPRPWTRTPAALATGGLAVLALGVGLGVGISRYTAPDQTVVPPGSRVPVPALPDPGPLLPGAPGTGPASMKTIPPEMLARMLEAARQS